MSEFRHFLSMLLTVLIVAGMMAALVWCCYHGWHRFGAPGIIGPVLILVAVICYFCDREQRDYESRKRKTPENERFKS